MKLQIAVIRGILTGALCVGAWREAGWCTGLSLLLLFVGIELTQFQVRELERGEGA